MRVIIAFDADKHLRAEDGTLLKPGVRRGEQKLIDALLPLVDVFSAEWNIAGGKGIDDLLTNGGTYRLVDRYVNPSPRPRVPRPCAGPGQVDGGDERDDVVAETAARIQRRFTPAYRGTIAIIAPPPGTAKTGSSLRAMEGSHVKAAFGVSRHEQADELVERAASEPCGCGQRRGDCVEHRLVLHHNYGRSKDNCVEFEVVEAAREAGYGSRVGAWICGSRDNPLCPHFRECAYQAQYERPGSHVAPVEVVTQRPTSTEQMGVVILDDLDSGRLIARARVTLELVQRAERSRIRSAVAPLLPVLKQAISMATTVGAYHCEAWELLEDAAIAGGSTLEAILAAVPPVSALVPAPDAESYRAAVPGQLLDLVELLHEEFPLFRSGMRFTSGLRITPAGLDVARLMLPAVKVDGQTALTGRAVAVLSSTPDPVLRQWVNNSGLEVVKEYRPSVALPPGVRVVQDVSAFHGKSATEQDDGRRLLAQARRCLDEFRPQRPAVVTFRGIRTQAAEALGIPLERVLYFGNLRGANSIRDADLLLILGTPGMDPADAYWNACAAYRGAGPPPSRRMVMTPQRYGGWVDGDGRGREVEVLTFADLRVAEVYETARRDELVQAIYRARPLDLGRPNDARTSLTVVLISEQPVQGLPVHDLRFGGNAARAEEAEARFEQAIQDAEAYGVQHTARSLAEAAGSSKNRASEYLRKVSAVCTPTYIRDLIQVGVQGAETLSALETDMALALNGGCSCVRCPANRGDRCNCGRFWYSPDRRPHCGVHYPPPAPGAAADAGREAPVATEAMYLE